MLKIGEQGEIQEPWKWVQGHPTGGRTQKSFPWLGPNCYWVFTSGYLQVWIL